MRQTPPRPYARSTTPELPISIPLRGNTLAAHVQSSIPLCLLDRFSGYLSPSLRHAPRSQSSRASYLNTSTSARLQRASRASCLHGCSMSLHLHLAPRAPYLHTSIAPCRYTCNASREFHTTMSPCRHACNVPPELRTSISLHLYSAPPRPPDLHIATPAARLQVSILPYTFT